MASMRVLQVGKFYAPHRGGIETHLQLLCEGLRPSMEVSALVASGNRAWTRETVCGISVTRAPTWLTLASAPICPGMAGEISRWGSGLLHVHLPNPPAVLACLASGHRGPFLATYHSDIVAQKLLGRAFEPILDRFLRRCASIIVTSPNYLEGSRALRRHRERCRVIPYGIPASAFERPRAELVAAVRERYGPRIILGVGRLVYYKGFEHLLRAMASVQARLLIIGDGPLRAALEHSARSLGLQGRVAFLGEMPTEDIVPYYHAADIFVLPSTHRSEAFGIVQLEAMACGKAVINTRLDSGVPFVSVHGETGLTVAPADPEALAAAIARLLGDPALSRNFGEAGRRRVGREFLLRPMVERTLGLYRQALGASLDLV